LSRIEAGRIDLHRAVVSVDEIVLEVIESLRPMAAAKGLELRAAPSSNPPLAFADRDKLQQVLLNLTENAVKFTPPGGCVTITTRPALPFIEVTVKDTGEGIPPRSWARSSTSSSGPA